MTLVSGTRLGPYEILSALDYVAPGWRLMAAPVHAAPGFEGGPPRELFRAQAGDYDVAADGQRFLVAVETEDLAASPITVVLKWTAGLFR